MTKLGFMFKDRVGTCQLKKYPFGTKTESEGWRYIMNVASHVCDFTYPVKNTRDNNLNMMSEY